MRVLTFTSLFPNRVKPVHGIFVYQRMSHFARRPGNSVVVVAPVPYFSSWLRRSKRECVPRQEQVGNLPAYHPRYPLIPKVSMPLHGWLMFLGSFSLVRRLHRQHKFDVIDAHYVYPDGFAAVLLGAFLGLPVVVSARGTDINLFPSFRLIRPMIRYTLGKASAVVAVSASLRNAMLSLGLTPDKVGVIGNGVDLERFFPLELSTARSRLNLPQDAQIAVSVGGLVEAKGHQYLVAALGSIVDRYPNLRAYIVGEGPLRAKLQSMIQAGGLQDHITLVGAQANEDLKFWYNAADVTVLTSSREGWPNVILESLACGTPVIATGVGGVPEVIVSPELGVIVEQTAHSVACGLETAFQRKWDRVFIERYARHRTWDRVAAELEQWFNTHLGVGSGVQASTAAENFS